jgi:hypothetical protein
MLLARVTVHMGKRHGKGVGATGITFAKNVPICILKQEESSGKGKVKTNTGGMMSKTTIEKLIVQAVRTKRSHKERQFPPEELKSLHLQIEEEIEDLEDTLQEKKEILREIQLVCKHMRTWVICPICGYAE